MSSMTGLQGHKAHTGQPFCPQVGNIWYLRSRVSTKDFGPTRRAFLQIVRGTLFSSNLNKLSALVEL